MNKADTAKAMATPLTERSPYLWNTVPTFWMDPEDGEQNPFFPEDWIADSEDAMVSANSSVEGLFYYPLVAVKGH